MKKYLETALCLVLICAGTLTARDIIVDKEGNRIEGKVLRILPESVEYTKLSNPHGPLYVVNKCALAEIVFENGEKEAFSGECSRKRYADTSYAKFTVAIEAPFGAFGLFNVDNVFTRARYTFGATPSFLVRFHRHMAAGAECMLLWGQAKTADPLRFIINPNLRWEIIFPLRPKLTLELITAAGLSIWPVQDTAGVLDTTFFNQRSGWNARAAFGAEWKMTNALSLMCNVGYSASSSANSPAGGQSNKVWITHDMMMVSAGVRYAFIKNGP